MSDRIVRIDIHTEITPPGVPVPVPHPVNTDIQSTQELVKIGGQPAVREGDTFACGHIPKVGVFQQPLPKGQGEGKISQAGQDVLKIDGKFAATVAGANESCSEGPRELPNQATVLLTSAPVLTVAGKPVLRGT